MPRFTISKYKRTRYWAVMLDESLLAVVAYKRGAREIVDTFTKRYRVLPHSFLQLYRQIDSDSS